MKVDLPPVDLSPGPRSIPLASLGVRFAIVFVSCLRGVMPVCFGFIALLLRRKFRGFLQSDGDVITIEEMFGYSVIMFDGFRCLTNLTQRFLGQTQDTQIAGRDSRMYWKTVYAVVARPALEISER